METEQKHINRFFQVGRQSKSKLKTLLTIFFDYPAVVRWEFPTKGITEKVSILHHRKVPAHRAVIIRNFLARHLTYIAPEASY